MMFWIFRLMVVISGPLLGWFKVSSDAKGIIIGTSFALFVILVEIIIERVPMNHLLFGFVGGGLGIIFAWFLNQAIILMNEPRLDSMVSRYGLLIYLVMGYLGVVIAVRRQEELEQLDRGELFPSRLFGRKDSGTSVIDTSAIIDGRIADVYETKFLTGTLVVPRFVLVELQHIADSSDHIKRVKGKRGLDILQRLQDHPDIQVKIYEKDFPEIKEVDHKIVMLAKEVKGSVITTDFNLNKVASLQGVRVLNINDLSNALKPIVLPGESMTIFVAKEGKEKEQGVGYLDDGTLVIIEEAKRLTGKKVEVLVASVLQTSSGRMIFTKLKEKPNHHSHPHDGSHPDA